MRSVFLYLLLVNVSCGQGQQVQKENVQQVFDIVSYKAPVGWQNSSTADALSFSKEDDKGNYCVITLCRSVEAAADAGSNFRLSWETMAMNKLGSGNASMQPESSDKGWQTLMGSAPFEKDGLAGVVILVNSSKNNRMVNILILTNTDTFQTEMEAFLESVTLRQAPSTNSHPANTASTNASNPVNGKSELWALRRNISNGSMFDKGITEYYVIYPNGDFYPNVPYNGLHNFDKSIHPESWGRFTIKGTEGRFKNQYNDIAVTRKSSTRMDRNGYAAGFHKCLPVDGLRIEGAYTHVSPDWGKDAQLNYLSGPGCQFVIYFNKDGTFDDRGVFSSLAGGCSDCNCQGGKGNYSIENFTITFQYDDGRVVRRLFSAFPAQDPATYNEAYFIGGTQYYKKKQRL
jgi:hypothetical protein